MLQWSRQQFDDESRRLVEALHTEVEVDDFASNDNTFLLNGWSIENSNKTDESFRYLVHPPVQRRNVNIATKSDPTIRGGNNDVIVGDDMMISTMIDENVLEDDPEILVLPTTSYTVHNIDDDDKTNNIDNKHNTAATTTAITTEWYFSIVYSDIWKVPVLYFTVQNLNANGSPSGRSEVLQILRQDSHYNRVGNADDNWDFLSHDEHPISGIPSFFLHPCQTRNRMQLLLTNTKKTTDNPPTNNDKISPPLVESAPANGKNFLVSWMTLILPSVGFSVPSKVYQKLEKAV